MTPLTLLFAYIIFAFLMLYLAIKIDGTKIKIRFNKESCYGLIRSIDLPLYKQKATTILFIWRVRIELSNTYSDIRKTEIFKQIFNQD